MKEWLRQAIYEARVLLMITAGCCGFVFFGLGIIEMIDGLFSDGVLFIIGSLMCFAISMKIETQRR